jgi:hypothetical protein
MFGGVSAGGIAGGIGDFLGAAGDFTEASDYEQAASLDLQNEEIAKQSTAIQESQAQRQVYQNLGGQQAAAAANGLATGGSAGDIYRSSVYQGALTKQLIGRQGLLEENQFAGEAAAAKGMASAATLAGVGGIVNGIGSIFGI